MLTILANWLYAAITAFMLGFGFSRLCERVFEYRLKRIDSMLMAGLVIATVYAQFFSLLGGVALVANIVLVLVCLGCFLLCRKDVLHTISASAKSFGAGKWVVLVILIGLWAFFSSRGYIHYDSDLYHGQSIRWIEEYGVVPGLGNLHERFAYNSSAFALSALYSMKFVFGQSMHAMSGFFALLLSITVLDLSKSWARKRFVLSDYAKVAAIYYLITIIDEVVSPASDYFIMCTIFFIVIKWLTLLEAEEKQIAPYALLCVVGVYSLTLKVTAGLILILLIKPAYLLIKEKRVKQIVLYLLMGLLVAVPWFVRTILISGWLLYPFPALDLFQVDWKISAEVVKIDATQISVWGKGLYNTALADAPLSQWIPNWFRTTLSGTEKILRLGWVGCVCLFIVGVIFTFAKKHWTNLDVLLVLFAVISSYLFWQFSAPLIRYGYAYVLLVTFICGGCILTGIGRHKIESIVYFVLLLYGIYKLWAIGEYIYGCRQVENYVWQKDYGTYELKTYEIEGITFYMPVQGDQTGYEFFPAAPTKPNIEFRGDGMESGFRLK